MARESTSISAKISRENLLKAAKQAAQFYREQHEAEREKYISDYMKTRIGWFWNRRHPTREEAIEAREHVWCWSSFSVWARQADVLVKHAECTDLHDFTLDSHSMSLLHNWLSPPPEDA